MCFDVTNNFKNIILFSSEKTHETSLVIINVNCTKSLPPSYFHHSRPNDMDLHFHSKRPNHVDVTDIYGERELEREGERERERERERGREKES